MSFEYLVAELGPAEFAVFVVHDDSPDWFRLIATFRQRERAVDYAEIENMSRDDFPERDHEKRAPAELPPAPESAVTPALLVKPTATEKARVGADLIGQAAQETGAQATVTIEAADKHGITMPSQCQSIVAEPDAKQPASIEPPQDSAQFAEPAADRLLRALIELRAEGIDPFPRHLKERSGVPTGSHGYQFEKLEKQGRVRRDPEKGWMPIERPSKPEKMAQQSENSGNVRNIRRIVEPEERKEPPKPWCRGDDNTLGALMKQESTFETCARILGRKIDDVERRAKQLGLGQRERAEA